MTKNFFYQKTGHGPSDEYFKNMAVWHDIDILKTFLFGLGIGVLVMFITCSAYAGQLTHQFKSPAFTGNGYSSHMLTIENQEFSRKKALKEKKEAAERQAARDAANTKLS